MESYQIPAAELTMSEETVKKSRFITYFIHTLGSEAARQAVQRIREQHPAARHHCWAWVAGAPSDYRQLGCSDDGEPSGTAGRPMLSQLMGSGVGEITAVVVRYYGGIMLGTGGLVKAYGGGVQTGLRLMARQVKVPKQAFALECQYAQLAETERIMKRFQGEIRTRDFQGQVRLIVALPASQLEACATALNDFSRGSLSLRPLVKTS